MAGSEGKARIRIDYLLSDAGWVLQGRDESNRNAALGVAVRKIQLPSGSCDYFLFIAVKAPGVIEAKKEGVKLSGVAEQSEKPIGALPPPLTAWNDNPLLGEESRGEEAYFKNMRDPKFRPNEQKCIFDKIAILIARLEKGEATVRGKKFMIYCRQSVLKFAVTGQITADSRAELEGDLEHEHSTCLDHKTRRENWEGRGKYKGFVKSDIAISVSEFYSKTIDLERWCATELKRSASLRQIILKDGSLGRVMQQYYDDEPTSQLPGRIIFKNVALHLVSRAKKSKSQPRQDY